MEFLLVIDNTIIITIIFVIIISINEYNLF